MMIKAVQQFMLGTVLNSEKQAKQTLNALTEAGYTGIELCDFMIHPAGLAVRLLTKAAGMPVGKGGKLNWHSLIQESGLKVVSLHYDLGTLEKDVFQAAEKAHSFGTRCIVITGMYGFDYGSEDAVRHLAQRLNTVGQVLQPHGISLLYHNHNCELRGVESGKKAYDILIDETVPGLVDFEFDSYWFAEAGADPVRWMERLGNRARLWHINDRGTRMTGKSMTPIVKSDSMELGTGNLPLDALMAQAQKCGTEAVVLESHRNWIDKSPIKSCQLSAKYLNSRMEEWGSL